MFRNKRAQSTLEYAVIIAVVIAALLAIQIYMKRGVEGKLRESTDSIGEQFDANNTTMNITRGRNGTTVQLVKNKTTSTRTSGETRTEFGSETVGSW